jgi:hypothetical protein
VAGAAFGGRCGAFALQPATALAAGTDDHPLLAAFFAHRSAALGVACHLSVLYAVL